MSKKVIINYCPNLTVPNFPVDLFIDPVRSYDLQDKNSIYYTCPAWSHNSKRTFDILSPIDVKMNLKNDGTYLECSTMEQEILDTFVDLPEGWCSGTNTTIQISYLYDWYFWSETKQNIWMQILPHPLSALSNVYAIGGWFNVSKWFRGTSFAFNVIDKSKPIIIKRGTPVMKIQFLTDNLDNTIVLKRAPEVPDHMAREAIKRPQLQSISKGLTNKLLFGKQEEKKCPFRFFK